MAAEAGTRPTDAEIEQRRSVDPSDPEIAEAERHRRAVFLAATPQKRNQVRTMSGQMWNLALKAFAKQAGRHDSCRPRRGLRALLRDHDVL